MASVRNVDTEAIARSASLLALLPVDARVKQIGPAAWLARCQFHDDRSPSMRVALTERGWGYFCYGCGARGNVIRFVQETRRLGFLDACAALTGGNIPRAVNDMAPSTRGEQPRAGKDGERRRITHTYDYFDESGVLLYQVVRLEPKSFRQRQPRPEGGWRWDMQGVRRVLYRLPELLAAPLERTVLVVEGEKDADALATIGRIVTTNVGGAGKWRAEYNETLRGRRVCILPDNDEIGHEHAEQVRAALEGVAGSVCIKELPGLPPKGDVSDWLASRRAA
jgi:DNA primase